MIVRRLRLLTRRSDASPEPSARMSKSEMTGEPVTSRRRLALGALAYGFVNIFKVGLQLFSFLSWHACWALANSASMRWHYRPFR